MHTALERHLTERIGPDGGRLQLGRSRNDQVLAALRLYLKDAVHDLASDARDVFTALHTLARVHEGLPLPGYTHLQRAMPSSVALWAGGFAAELQDDAEGLTGCLRRIDQNPLGSAAGYGTPGLPIDREHTRLALGFARVQEPVTAVQLSRGKAEAQVLFEVCLLSADLGRLASDLVLFASAEFGFVELAEEMTTGSSFMPQKKNPDLFELAPRPRRRSPGGAGRGAGHSRQARGGYRDLQLEGAALPLPGPGARHLRLRRHASQRALPARAHRALAGCCGRGGLPPGARGRDSFPRRLPPRGRGGPDRKTSGPGLV